MQLEAPGLIGSDNDLATGDAFATKGANVLVVDRAPTAAVIGASQDFQALVGGQIEVHADFPDQIEKPRSKKSGAGLRPGYAKFLCGPPLVGRSNDSSAEKICFRPRWPSPNTAQEPFDG
jgi:hypothetical protein